MASGDTKTEAMLNALGNGGSADEFRGCCNTKTQQYILDAIDRVQNVEDEVEELKNNPDVVDIVDTYADLQAYDTQHLTENDIIRVLQDETHSSNSTYYRFTKNPDTWTFIGEISGGSSVNVVQTTGTSQSDVMSQNATTSIVYADPGTNTKIGIGYISTIGTEGVAIGSSSQANGARGVALGRGAVAVYKGSVAIGSGSSTSAPGDFNIGANSSQYGYNNTVYRLISGVHDPVNAHDAATKGYVDANAGGPTIVQTTGTSTTDVMSQNAVTSMVFADPATQQKVKIGAGTSSNEGSDAVEIGHYAEASNNSSISIGGNATANGAYSVHIGPAGSSNGDQSTAIGYSTYASGEKALALGRGAAASYNFSVALGAGSTPTAQGEINVGTGSIYTTKGYNNSNYRLLSGLYDGQNDHDAVTVGQVNSVIDAINTALSTNIPHIGA